MMLSEQALADAIGALRRTPELRGWEFERELGRGGMGVVLLAVGPGGVRRAVKLVLPRATPDDLERRQFEREIDVVMGLNHANVVRTDAWGAIPSGYFISMEYCDGGDLYGLVGERGPLDVARAVDITVGVLDALGYAHHVATTASGAVGIVHRDVKPPNILFAGRNSPMTVKLADFGLAKAYDTAGMSGLTHTGSSAGTPAFMPRSQVLDYKRAKPEVDVWAAAASLYFAVTGRTPRDFPAGRDPWLVVTRERPVPIAARRGGIPEALGAVIDTALADDAAPRYPTAAALGAALRSAVG
jgi:serine/threonine protein kinase